jgi:very-short-patch-repair endonuclease
VATAERRATGAAKPRSEGEETLALHIRAEKLPEPVREHVFAPPRKWRLDFAWPEQKLAVEVEGGIFTAGRHSRGAGLLADMAKYNAAALAGWRVLRFFTDQVRDGTAIATIKGALKC